MSAHLRAVGYCADDPDVYEVQLEEDGQIESIRCRGVVHPGCRIVGPSAVPKQAFYPRILPAVVNPFDSARKGGVPP